MSAPSETGHTVIAKAAAAQAMAARSSIIAATTAGRCITAGCTASLFQGGLCFEHARLEKIKNCTAISSTTRKPIATANKNTVVELVNSVRTQPEFARMVGYSIECIRKLAVDEVAVEEILESGTIQALEAAVALHPENAKLHKQYMEALQAFSINGRLARQVGSLMNNNFNKLGHSLRTHNDVDTHIATAKAIINLSNDPMNMDLMADQGVLDALADAVKRNPGNAELLAAAAKVFSKFAGYKNEYADFITKSGATEVIIAAMQKTPLDKELAQNGAELLSILAGTGQHNMDALKRAGAVDALIAALEAHPFDKKLEDYATRALGLLTGEDDMIRALNICSGNMALDLATAKALSKVGSLLLVGENVETMFRHKGIDWLIATLTIAEGQLDANGCKILENGLRALMRSAIDVNKIYDIMKHGGVQLLVSLLNTHVDKGVIAAALGALGRMIAGREDYAGYVVAHGGVNSTLRAYACFPNDYDIVRPVLDILAACTYFPGTSELIVAAGSIEALIDMLKRHMHDVGLVKDILSALGRLATSEDAVRQMAAGGLLELLVAALKQHMDDPEAVRLALLAIETAALLPENIPKLLALGAVEAIHAAKARWPHHAEIQAIGGRALDLLLRAQADELERARLAALERARLEEEERLRREQLEREQMERDMAAALKRLKEQDAKEEEEERARRKAKEWEDNIKLKAMREKEEAERLLASTTIAPVKPAVAKPPTWRSARALFEEEEGEDEKPLFEMDPELKQFLLSGQMLTKHNKINMPSNKHVYLTQDMERLIWNKPMTDVHIKNTMLATSIFDVTPGKTTPPLQRVRFGQALAGEEDRCFSIFGALSDGTERTIDLECRSSSDCDKWIQAIRQLIRWVKTRKLYGAGTLMMNSKDKIIKKVAKEERKAGQQ